VCWEKRSIYGEGEPVLWHANLIWYSFDTCQMYVSGSHGSEGNGDNFVTTFSHFFNLNLWHPFSSDLVLRGCGHFVCSALIALHFLGTFCPLPCSFDGLNVCFILRPPPDPNPPSFSAPLVKLPRRRRLEGSRLWRDTYQSSEGLGQESRMGMVAQITGILWSYLSFYYIFVVVAHWKIYCLDFFWRMVDEKERWGLFTPLVTLIFQVQSSGTRVISTMDGNKENGDRWRALKFVTKAIPVDDLLKDRTSSAP